ncbi:MAG: hypothetical protein A3A86_07870 [Elusimicrobia bacterium RIFCSPLOWO2_01_FULL_60_11]|nr:MAG: hypothetical protein A3A86_07870 [Elusimicrobia bacterium RIFCSPLOWO2_01_FULL_60_11]
MRTGGLLSLAFLFAWGLAPPLRASGNPANDSAAFVVKIRPQVNLRPDPITDLDASGAVNEGEVLLQWTAPDSDGFPGVGPPVSNYYVRYATFSVTDLAGDTTAWWTMASTTYTTTGPPQPQAQSESEILTGLEPGATLYFAIKSRSVTGNVSFIDILSETGPQANALVPDAAPPVVTGLSLAVSSRTLVLSWTASTATDVANYRIYMDSQEPQDIFIPTVTAPSGTTFYAFNDLISDNTYYFYVTALDKGLPAFLGDVLESAPSSVVSAVPVSTIAPVSPIQGLMATPGDRQVALDWDDSTDPSVAGYFVYRSLADIGPFAKVNLTALTSSYFQDTGLTNGVTYFYALTTADAGGTESVFSSTVSARPRKSAAGRPQEPTGVFGVLSSTGTFTLNWSAVTMDITLSTRVELASYRIYKSSALEGPFYYRDAVAPDAVSWISPDLVPPTVWYLVRAVDTSDNESDDSMRVETLPVTNMTAVSRDETVRVVFMGDDSKVLRGGTNGRGEDLRIIVERETYEEQGNVLGSYAIKSIGAASGNEFKDMRFTKPTVGLYFRFSKGLKAPYIKPGPAFRYAGKSFKDVSVFWHNQVEFVKFGGAVDEDSGVVSVKSASPLGRYQVRQVLRGTEFAITQITPRKIFTPNGDGVNDEIILFLENPNDSVISQARIFDLTGAEVADFEQGIVAGEMGVISLKWNGKDRSGGYARSGVYIYQIKADGKTLNGTMVVAR